jgi:hypothetical protein
MHGVCTVYARTLLLVSASKATGRRLPYALGKIAYGGRHGTHGTVPARRGDIGEADAGDKRSPAQGRFLSPYKTTRLRNFPTGGGLGTGGGSRDGASRTPPTPGSWLHNFIFTIRGPRTLSHGRGVEKPKGTELLESAAKGWSNRRGCKARSR